jgi:RNA polymerase sigma-70 factor (ECF subfamily)
VNSQSDETLLNQYFEGDAAAFRAFYRRHAGRVHAYAQGKGLNAQAAEEVRQEAFLRLHHSIHRYERGRPALPWFFTIVHHCVIDRLRQNQNLVRMTAQLEYTSATDVIMEPVKDDKTSAILASLSADQRQVVELRVFQDHSFKDMAHATGKSETALRKIFERARHRMRRYWEGGAE